MKHLKWLIVLIVITLIIIWSVLHDDIRCIVHEDHHHMSSNSVSGYYVAIGGIYINIATNLLSIPDIFHIFSLHSLWSKGTTIITQDRHEWIISTLLPPRQKLYSNSPSHPQEYLFHPPPTDWKPIPSNLPSKFSPSSSPRVDQCVGSLADSLPLIPERSQTNLQILMNRPITTILCLLILWIAYYLWSQRIEVSSVSYSYDAIINREEFWRFFTASFSHFDLLHLAFNLMSLYQLGTLESIYSSPLFLTLNFTLVIVTMIIATGLYHHMIYSWNRHDLMYQQAVGFSCVLFAWMVASSVRMEQYCPLFFLPSLCFSTYFITIPFLPFSLTLPVNIGPFVLLIVTKFILPRSSLIGHLSGIIIGFPLAWNWLNFLTPTVVLASLAIFFFIHNQLFVWKFPGYNIQHSFAELEEFVPKDSLSIFISIRYLVILLCLTTFIFFITTVAISLSTLLSIILPRCVLIIFTLFSISAMRCVWLTDLQTVHLDSAFLIAIPGVLSFAQSILDFFSFFGLLMAKDLVISSLSLSYDTSSARTMYWSGVILFLLLAMMELFLSTLLLQALHKIKFVDSTYLIPLQLDRQSFNQTMKAFGWTSSTSFTGSASSTTSANTQQHDAMIHSTIRSHLPSSPTPTPTLAVAVAAPVVINNQMARAALARQANLPPIFTGNRTKATTKSTNSSNPKKKSDSDLRSSFDAFASGSAGSSDEEEKQQKMNSFTI
jgi:membrane associated rhomboid family serine protease